MSPAEYAAPADPAAPADHAALAEELLTAHRTGVPVPPLTERHPDLGLDGAYAIQLAQVRARTGVGARVSGHKIGLTSAAIQQQLGVREPDFGHLFADMEIVGRTISTERFIAPRAEPELAFVLGRELHGPHVTTREAAAAVCLVLPALEIIDSRIADWRIGLPDTVADNASCGAYVLGTTGVPLDRLDLNRLGCVLRAGAEIAETGSASAVLGNPLAGLAWLANTLGRHGTSLQPGQVILSGSMTAAVDLAPGTTISAEFQGLGHLALHVEEKERP
ncbi:2-keto-4-pentenoate hydratase [Streptomyces glebosus]|uniref:2-keto-4-pentenoate hydratase n=1 Tax=Streptomyces glebosus TaxID=249580 RepID=A0A640SPF3_9ACTN|nr:fumarylacetoacetate hydrolase family protein [Streptomyces glebosus]GFE13197.1 2-keto-4-pentenoate hydratase [Streptomyces glebosus]GHG78653.1 2-keto-4-pentenoate hydratase [Streptomyces glebosus]